MRFYNYTLDQVLNLQTDDFVYLMGCMVKILAIEQIDNFQVSSFPHLKADEMKSVHRKAYMRAEADDVAKKNVIKLSDIAKVLKNG